MAAPTAEVVRFAVVRPGRREIAQTALGVSLLIAATAEIQALIQSGDVAQIQTRKDALLQLLDDNRAEIEVGRRLLAELRGSLANGSMDDSRLAELRGAFAPGPQADDVLAALKDRYILALWTGDHEFAAGLVEPCRAMRALTRIQSIGLEDIEMLASPVLVVDLPPRRKQADLDTKGAEESIDHLATRYVQEALALRVTLDTLRDIRKQKLIKTVWAATPPVNPPNGAGGAETAQTFHPEADASLVASIDLQRKLGEWITGFLRRELGVDDLNSYDLLNLWAFCFNAHNDRVSHLLKRRPPRAVSEFQREFRRAANAWKSGYQDIVKDALSALAVGGLSAIKPLAPSIVKPKGIADLKVVRQQLQKYGLGEIAHIENVLEGETRVRTHHYGEKVEQLFSIEEEETSTTEKDLQTTERFELSQEMQQVINEKQRAEAGLNVSATYGVVTIAADAKLASEQSIEQSAKTARNYVRETIAKAAERIEKRSKRQTSVTTTVETTEDNTHSFSATSKSISGIYRWVEKHYWCQTFNYGARLMFEIELPDPAAFYLYSLSVGASSGAGLRQPDPPSFTADDLDENTYQILAAPYGASVSAPPPAFHYARIGTAQGKEQGDTGTPEKYEIDIGEGYEMLTISPVAYVRVLDNGRSAYGLAVAPFIWTSSMSGWPRQYFPDPVRNKFELAITGIYVQHYSISANLVLYRTEEAFAKWQLTTFNAIQDAYLAQKSDYERKLAALQARRQTVTARSSQEYRDIERAELKRLGIQLVTGQDYSQFDAMKYPVNAPPVMDANEAVSEGSFVRFAEDNFEWDEMIYTFYPYFWGGAKKGEMAYSEGNEDPIFQRFLRAGFSKAVIPVKPGAERSVLYYLETGTIWTADEPPTPNDPTYLSIVLELEALNSEDRLVGVPEGSPWLQIVPTNLVCLETKELQLPTWEIDVPAGKIGYRPSRDTCRGQPYNLEQWPDDYVAVLQSLAALGFSVGKPTNPLAYLRSADGILMVRAFQTHANAAGVGQALGAPLRVDGKIGPCTLRGLTIAVAMNLAGKWPRPT
jgi:hypothetical protein